MQRANTELFQLVAANRPLGLFHHPESLPLSLLPDIFGGVLPRGGIAEIFGGASSGKTTFAHVVVSTFVRRGEFAAWVDLPNSFDPRCARNAGIELDRVLWVAPPTPMLAVRVVEQVLGTGGFRVVVLDLGDVSARPGLSTSIWLRMSRVAKLRHAAILVLAATRVAGTFSALSLEASEDHRAFVGEGNAGCFFEGASNSFRIRRVKGGLPSDRALRFFASTPE